MVTQNFTAVGRMPGKCMFVYKDDVDLLKVYPYTGKVKCVRIDFDSGDTSEPIIVDVLLKFCPHEDVYSEGERQVISELVQESLSEDKIIALNQQFEEIKCQE